MADTIAAEIVTRPVATVGPLGWMRRHLFSTWYNALLTLLGVVGLLYMVPPLVRWLVNADWEVVTLNIQVLLVGQYLDEEVWRPAVAMLPIPLVLGLAWAVWPQFCRGIALSLAAGGLLAAILPVSFPSLGFGFRIYLALNPVLVAGGYLLGRNTPLGRPIWVIAFWFVLFLATLTILRGFPGSELLPLVQTKRWGGLIVTLLLAQAGIVVSFPLGVVLALGRRSTLPFVRIFCIAYIEVLRGTPLLALLFVTQVLLPLMLPDALNVDRLTRGLIALILNNSAYMAENVRGGLQSVPNGQVEAARAIGLRPYYITLFVVLPQALRNVLPAIVGQFIILFKDTAVISLLGLLDLLGTARSVLSGRQRWFNSELELFLFVAAIYWVFTYAMTRVSRSMEREMGVGQR